ncbi:DUF4785 domain-containing protein [Pseudoalteromonas sp. BDTF-M6]|uniref:DUF4785 domain-containing protein n=1 Tax=Pseudoalteromonas sp. BDTF-M6 TaxID=2796132 RepID=UPI001BB0266C|nr:DUF4785 domain-containing protein [Pseudoalteromonas sp. BDTF-M6]MBS3797096.1 DUF4785 family protein [Pseudoalteromonas sp. BDTF-M6]
MKKLTTVYALMMFSSTGAMADAGNTQTVYQFPQVQATPATPLRSLEKTSVEYWQQVSGKELKQGVPVFVNQADHLIRVAPKARFENGEVIKPYDLQLDKFSVRDAQSQRLMPVQAIAAREQMQQAGFNDGSVGLKLGQINGKGQPMLHTTQALNDQDIYLVHVIEKGSGNALQARTQFTLSEHQQRLGVELNMGSQKLQDKNVQLKLHSPTGERIGARYQGGEAIFDQPLTYLGAANGYYELEASVDTQVNGKKVKRSVKMPFVHSMQTISMSDAKVQALGGNQYRASVPVEVTDSGRYAIRATLTGRADNGERIRLATVEVAKELDSNGQFLMPFSATQGANAPYRLVDIELTDQTRMLKFTPQ